MTALVLFFVAVHLLVLGFVAAIYIYPRAAAWLTSPRRRPQRAPRYVRKPRPSEVVKR